MVKDIIHCQFQGPNAGGVDHVVSFDHDRDGDNSPAFAAGGRGLIDSNLDNGGRERA